MADSGVPRILSRLLAIATVGGPAGYLVGSLLEPAVHAPGAQAIALNAAASPLSNGVHLAAYVLASFLLAPSAVGLAVVAFPRAPRLATAAGLVGVLGWLPFPALTALDDLTALLGRTAEGRTLGDLLDAFGRSPVMGLFLLVAGWALLLSTPITVVAFAVPGDVGPITEAVGLLGLLLLTAGCVPPAVILWGARLGSRESRAPAGAHLDRP
jgi:hypothetical protein